jgi:hypothetical protein
MDYKALRRVYATLAAASIFTLVLTILQMSFSGSSTLPLAFIGFAAGIIGAAGVLYVNRSKVELTMLTPEQVADINKMLEGEEEGGEEEVLGGPVEQLEPCIGFMSTSDMTPPIDEEEDDEE